MAHHHRFRNDYFADATAVADYSELQSARRSL
jgi:hypothetical protein